MASNYFCDSTNLFETARRFSISPNVQIYLQPWIQGYAIVLTNLLQRGEAIYRRAGLRRDVN